MRSVCSAIDCSPERPYLGVAVIRNDALRDLVVARDEGDELEPMTVGESG